MRRYRRRESGGGSSATAGTAPTSSNVRRSSRPFTSSAAAAEFWSNFNYVDVVSGDDTSHRRLRRRKQSIAVPRFSLDRRSSESRNHWIRFSWCRNWMALDPDQKAKGQPISRQPIQIIPIQSMQSIPSIVWIKSHPLDCFVSK